LYTINITHKGADEPTTYYIYREDEAKEEKLDYKYWKSASSGDYALSDDGYVAKVIKKSVYPGNRGLDSVYLRFPWGYVFYNTKYAGKKLLVKGRKTNTTMTGNPYQEVKGRSDKYKNLAMVYSLCLDPEVAINMTFGSVSDTEKRRWKRTIKTKNFKNMVREELQGVLTEHGLTENYTLDLLESTITLAKDKKDVTNLMRAIENLQDMHGMKDKHLVKTTDKIEATSTTTLIDELREEEQKLVATRTTFNEDTGEVRPNETKE